MKHVLILAISLTMTACATGYKRIGEQGTVIGYDEALIRTGQYRVTYQGAVGDSPVAVYSNFTRRCAELARDGGAPFFKITEGQQASTATRVLGGMADLPSYTGTCTFADKDAGDSLSVEDTLKRAVASDKRGKDSAREATKADSSTKKNPFAPSSF